MGSRDGLVEKVEMIGGREIDVRVLLLPERSRAERAGRAKKRTIPIVLPSGGAAAARKRHRAKQHRGYIGRGKVTVFRLSAYILPAASRDAARRAWGIPSCYFIPLRPPRPSESSGILTPWIRMIILVYTSILCVGMLIDHAT
jgi:hypothetical protein